jgi:hypothetical protein
MVNGSLLAVQAGIAGFSLALLATLEAVSVGASAPNPDIGHVWPFWRQNLADFVQLLFK